MAFCGISALQLASLLIGAVIGVLAFAIFYIILLRLSEKQPQEAIKHLYKLIGLPVGGGLGDYAIFDRMLSSGSIAYYMQGLAVTFLVLAIWFFVPWRRK